MSDATDAGTKARTTTDAPHTEKPAYAGLNATQRDLLCAVQHLNGASGSEILDHLRAYYAPDGITSPPVYTNLNTLATEGLVSKSERDNRTNEYALTHEGEQALEARDDWTATGGRDE